MDYYHERLSKVVLMPLRRWLSLHHMPLLTTIHIHQTSVIEEIYEQEVRNDKEMQGCTQKGRTRRGSFGDDDNGQ
jgi:hypothetical protein